MKIRSNEWLGCRAVRTTLLAARGTGLRANVACRALLAAAIGLSWAGAAPAGYVGESFLQIPDVSGDARTQWRS